MAYRVVSDFIDSKDKNKEYKRGEEYPRGVYEPSQARLKELSSLHPQYNLIFIEEVAEPKKAPSKTKTPTKTTKAADDKNDKS